GNGLHVSGTVAAAREAGPSGGDRERERDEGRGVEPHGHLPCSFKGPRRDPSAGPRRRSRGHASCALRPRRTPALVEPVAVLLHEGGLLARRPATTGRALRAAGRRAPTDLDAVVRVVTD